MSAVPWPPEREARLLKLVATRPHIVDVANELGTTRNAVIGKIARMKRRGETVDRPARAPAAARSAPLQGSNRTKRLRALHQAATLPDEPEPQPVQLPKGRPADPWRTRLEPDVEMRRLTLMQLRRRVCRWPIGDPGKPGFCFCGNDTEPDRSYCEPHYDFAHT